MLKRECIILGLKVQLLYCSSRATKMKLLYHFFLTWDRVLLKVRDDWWFVLAMQLVKHREVGNIKKKFKIFHLVSGKVCAFVSLSPTKLQLILHYLVREEAVSLT